jgi:hypothetical protein
VTCTAKTTTAPDPARLDVRSINGYRNISLNHRLVICERECHADKSGLASVVDMFDSVKIKSPPHDLIQSRLADDRIVLSHWLAP